MLYLKNKAVVPDPFTAKKHIFKPDDHAVQGEQTSNPPTPERVSELRFPVMQPFGYTFKVYKMGNWAIHGETK